MNWNQIPIKELYPFERSAAYKWKATILFGLFVFLFLWVFQPFGLNNPIPNKILILLGYGAITSFGVFIGMFAIPKLFPTFFLERKWYLWKEVFYSMLVILIIAFLNLLYSTFLGFFQFTFYNLSVSLLMTLALGIFPVTASIFISYYRHLKRNIREAKHLSHSLPAQPQHKDRETITLYDYENRVVAQIGKDDILRLEAAQNYVEVYFFNDKEKLDKLLIRNTMKEIEQQFESIPIILRVHRSHMVNLKQVQQVKGNAQGLQLDLVAGNEEVPVSRTYLHQFESRFRDL